MEYHADRYYNQDDPEISDFEYDRLFHQLLDLEEANPQYASAHRTGERAVWKERNYKGKGFWTLLRLRKEKLLDLEEANPQYASPTSPTVRVGGSASNTFSR